MGHIDVGPDENEWPKGKPKEERYPTAYCYGLFPRMPASFRNHPWQHREEDDNEDAAGDEHDQNDPCEDVQGGHAILLRIDGQHVMHERRFTIPLLTSE